MIKDGCDLHSTCKICPYPDCYEGNSIKVNQYNRRIKAKKLQNKGLTYTDIAWELNVCEETIRRDLGFVR